MSEIISVSQLTGVGPSSVARLSQLNIHTVQDLLFHLPFRYEDRTRVHGIASVREGDRVLVEGVVQSLEYFGRKKYLRCTIRDASHRSLDLVFYHFTASHEKRLSQLQKPLRCFGEVRVGMTGQFEISHPEYAPVSRVEDGSILALSTCLLPVYSTTKGLTQITLRKLTHQALTLLKQKNILADLLPETFRKKLSLFELHEALAWMHFPPVGVCLTDLLAAKHPAHQRLIMEELIAHQASKQVLRDQAKKQKSIPLAEVPAKKDFLSKLPFALTGAQSRVIAEITKDLMTSSPMLRLVQGDVGSGKTVVACAAALQAIANGFQVAFMAPTEILAEQHANTISKWLPNLSIALLTGKQTATTHRSIKSQLKSGDIQWIIGTHALFQQDVSFKNLALLIVDEQHRFGVAQRLALMEKGLQENIFPHQLMMTATPIPRTLAMTHYAELDLSVIDELPPGRQSIVTALVDANRRDSMMARVRAHCQQGKQGYWICTLVEESEVLQCQAAESTALKLQEQLPDLRVGLIHGRQKPVEKQKIMTDFANQKIDLLVATTVVEVGVDVPNASLIVIENPERLGLSQLHQLRGRVGRGSDQSYCILLYQSPLSAIARKRLGIMRQSQDGFLIAEKDFELRGPGDILGVRQSGDMQLRVADLTRDYSLLVSAQKVVKTLSKSHSNVLTALANRWIGSDAKYGKV